MNPIVRRLGRKATPLVARALGEPLRRAANYLGVGISPTIGDGGPSHYERVYEHVAQVLPEDISIGDGNFDVIGRIELGVLIMEGLQPHHTLFDMGCGTGRLTIHAVPYLTKGRYVGSDISDSMLAGARKRLALHASASTCDVSFVKQRPDLFDLPDASVDYICAFSVFTHMEAEDTYRYLRAARRLLKPDGRLLLSCLPMRLSDARKIFLAQAEMAFEERWKGVRNFTTSVEQMEAIAEIAGWSVLRWYPGDEPSIRVAFDDQMIGLGQSVCTLVPRQRE